MCRKPCRSSFYTIVFHMQPPRGTVMLRSRPFGRSSRSLAWSLRALSRDSGERTFVRSSSSCKRLALGRWLHRHCPSIATSTLTSTTRASRLAERIRTNITCVLSPSHLTSNVSPRIGAIRRASIATAPAGPPRMPWFCGHSAMRPSRFRRGFSVLRPRSPRCFAPSCCGPHCEALRGDQRQRSPSHSIHSS
jgi:hypothetical protein